MHFKNLPLPDTAFHGTSKDFDRFSAEQSQFDEASYGVGFYFSPDRDVASRYGPIVIEVRIQLRNPFRIQLSETPDGRELMDFDASLKTLASKTSLQLPDYPRLRSRYPHEVIEEIGSAFFTRLLKTSGHDGVVVQAPRHLEELVIFDSNAISILNRSPSTFEVFAGITRN